MSRVVSDNNCHPLRAPQNEARTTGDIALRHFLRLVFAVGLAATLGPVSKIRVKTGHFVFLSE